MSYLLGIDLGSTSIKAVIYDERGRMVSEGTSKTILTHPDKTQPSWAVWQPDDIWQGVCNATRAAMRSVEKKDALEGVAVTGFGMDGLPISKSGEELYPLISWHCSRTDKVAKKFAASFSQEKLYDISGGQFMNIHSIYRMIWLKENHPDIMKKTHKWLLIEDYINYKLCGEMGTDFSMGWCTSALDQKNKQWSEEIISAAGIDLDIFPAINQSGTVLGQISQIASASTDIPKGVKVVTGGHDYICGALAVGAIDDNVTLDVTGTWEMVVQPTQHPNKTKILFDNGFYIQNHVVEDAFCYAGSTVCGDMTEWFKSRFGFEEEWMERKKGVNVWKGLMDKANKSNLGAHGCMFLPHFSGAGAPIMDSTSLGAYVGLNNEVSKGDMVRATIEGLDYQLRQMIESLEDALDSKAEKIVAMGGAIKNEFWMQNKADVCNKQVEVPEIHQAAALGAAMLAGIGCGIYSDYHDATKAVYKRVKTYEPDMKKTKLYDEYYNEIFLDLYGALKGVNQKIFKKISG